jgi:hypothetical protein
VPPAVRVAPADGHNLRVGTADEFAASLSAISTLMDRVRSHLVSGHEAAGEASRELDRAFSGSPNPQAEDAVASAERGHERVNMAITALDRGATEFAGYVAQVLGSVAGGRSGIDVSSTTLAPRRPARLHPSMASIRPAEQATARRLADDPAFEGREFFGAPSPDPGYDWYDDLGRTYDAMGDGTKAAYYRRDQFTASIDHHLNKGNDFTVIDLTGYRGDQIREIDEYVSGLPADKRKTIVRVGF